MITKMLVIINYILNVINIIKIYIAEFIIVIIYNI